MKWLHSFRQVNLPQLAGRVVEKHDRFEVALGMLACAC